MLTATTRIISILLLTFLSFFFILGTQLSVYKEKRPTTIENTAKIDPVKRVIRTEPLPNFTQIYNTQEKKQRFFGYLSPIVEDVNNTVLFERNRISALSQKPNLTNNDRRYLKSVAKKYRVTSDLQEHSTFFQSLLTKVDRIPPSLVLAQAANESAWGTSRFAIEGNNLFGQWCFSKGCGLVPARRNDDATHEVAKFNTVFNSVESYILNLNRHSEYKELRAIRDKLRQNNQPVNGIPLAGGLLGYSERGQDYVNEIQSIIRFNNLSSLDKRS